MARQVGNIVKNLDWQIVIIYIFLVFAGWINIYSAVFDESAASIFDVTQKYGKQLIWIIAAFLVAVTVLIIDSRVYFSFAYFFYGFIILSLIVVYFLGVEVNGGRSWIEIGPLRIQPSEFAKLATSLTVAKYLGSYGIHISGKKWKDLFVACFILLIPAALIVWQGDAGTALVFAAFFLAFYREGMPLGVLLVGIYFILVFSLSIIWGGASISLFAICVCLISFVAYGLQKNHKLQPIVLIAVPIIFLTPILIYHIFDLQINEFFCFLAGFGILLVPTLWFSYKKKNFFIILLFGIGLSTVVISESVEYVFYNILEEHQRTRIEVFFGLKSDPRGSEFNVIQSKIAIGSGDLTGKGFLNGTQTKNNFVPEQSTDFIFCTIGEEWGFAGAVVILGLFIYLIIRIMKVAERQRTRFSRIYGYCVASILFMHVMINIGMTIGLMPVIGIPLPFFSYGGSSLWGFTLLLFIFLKLDVNREELIQ